MTDDSGPRVRVLMMQILQGSRHLRTGSRLKLATRARLNDGRVESGFGMITVAKPHDSPRVSPLETWSDVPATRDTRTREQAHVTRAE